MVTAALSELDFVGECFAIVPVVRDLPHDTEHCLSPKAVVL